MISCKNIQSKKKECNALFRLFLKITKPYCPIRKKIKRKNGATMGKRCCL